MHQIPEAVFVQVLRFKFLDETHKDARLAPLIESDLHVGLLLASIQPFDILPLNAQLYLVLPSVNFVLSFSFIKLLFQVLAMRFTQGFLLLVEQVFGVPFVWGKFLPQFLHLLEVLFVFVSDEIKGPLPLFSVLINAILHHEDHFVVSVIIIACELLCDLFDDHLEVVLRKSLHELLPDRES